MRTVVQARVITGEEDMVTNRKIMMVLKDLCHRERQTALKKHIMSHLVWLG